MVAAHHGPGLKVVCPNMVCNYSVICPHVVQVALATNCMGYYEHLWKR